MTNLKIIDIDNLTNEMVEAAEGEEHIYDWDSNPNYRQAIRAALIAAPAVASVVELNKRIEKLEKALLESADDIIEHGRGYFREKELADKYRKIVNGD